MIIWVGQMPPGQMARFVRQHPDDLVRGVRLHQRTMVDEDAAPIGDEGVKDVLIDDDDLDILLLQARGAENWPRIVPQELFGLSIAENRQRLFFLGASRNRTNRERHRRDDGGDFHAFPEQGYSKQHRAGFIDWQRV
jgi:hypothetical protein